MTELQGSALIELMGVLVAIASRLEVALGSVLVRVGEVQAVLGSIFSAFNPITGMLAVLVLVFLFDRIGKPWF